MWLPVEPFFFGLPWHFKKHPDARCRVSENTRFTACISPFLSHSLKLCNGYLIFEAFKNSVLSFL